MNQPDPNTPLVNDPAREAIASIRGYATQIWRSVLEWIKLDDDERLYLEGAEDIDRVHGSQAETIQVKDVAGNITLRSSDVIEAINNAFAHRERNPARKVRFRFLTTGGIGLEKSSSFRDGLAGIALWQLAHRSVDKVRREADATEIANFLLKEGKVSSAVLHFLRTSSAPDIWSQLVSVIEWDANAEGAEGVISDINDRLISIGESFGVPARQSEKVADHLCAIALETATREKDRFLTRAALLRYFGEHTQVSMPAATANALLAVVPGLVGAAQSLPVAVGGAGNAIGRLPPLPHRYFARRDVLAAIDARLRKVPVVVVQGGTGVGKTVIATAYAANSTATWSWVNLRNLKDAALGKALHSISEELSDEPGIAHLVLDDAEMPADPRACEQPLQHILRVLEARSGRLIITSTAPVPQRLRLAMNMAPEDTLSVAPLDQSEIQQFLVTRGCPEKSAEGLAFFIELHTGGHAQLVHARVATLESQGFPSPKLETAMSTPGDVIEARTEARNLIRTLSESERELICRLSLTIGALPRKQVMAIALRPPPIAEAGHAFDALVGPWMETVADGVFRASPLLKELARDVRGDDWATKMHGQIATALLGFRTLTPSDISTILFHAVAGREWRAIARLAIGIMTANHEVWKALAASVGWFLLVATEPGTHRPETDSLTLLLVRMLQFRLALASADEKRLLIVLQRLDQEVPSSVEEVPLRLSRYVFLAQALSQPEVRLPVAVVARIGVEYIALTDQLAEQLGTVQFPADLDPWLTGPDGKPDKAGIAGFSLMTAIRDTATLRQVLDVCESLPEDTARRLLWVVGGHESLATQVLNRVWLAETNRSHPEWEECRAQLQRANTIGRRYRLPALRLAAAIADSRILHENLKDTVAALDVLATAAKEIGSPAALEDQRASILLQTDPGAALEIWRRVLPTWKPRDELELEPPYACRLAAIAAARLDLWQESADWFARASDLVANDGQTAFRAGLLVDQGYARWRSGNNQEALACFERAFEILGNLDIAGDTKSYLTMRYAGHTLMWVAALESGETLDAEFSAPPPGACSLPNALIEPDGPRPPPMDAILADILKFEFAAKLGDRLFKLHETRLRSTSYGLIRFSFSQLRMRRRLQSLMMDDFVAVVVDRAVAAAIGAKYYKDGGLEAHQPMPDGVPISTPEELEPEIILAGMLDAIFALAARATVDNAVLVNWRATARQADVLRHLESWLDLVEKLFVSNTVNASEVTRDQSVPWYSQLTASVRVATDDDAQPNELLTMHHFWTSLLHKQGKSLLVLTDVEHLIAKGWQVQSERPFLLRTPAISVPALRKACASNAKGWRKIGEVLRAACDAVPGTVPPIVRELFEKLAREG